MAFSISICPLDLPSSLTYVNIFAPTAYILSTVDVFKKGRGLGIVSPYYSTFVEECFAVEREVFSPTF
jgi:hypothetical protein